MDSEQLLLQAQWHALRALALAEIVDALENTRVVVCECENGHEISRCYVHNIHEVLDVRTRRIMRDSDPHAGLSWADFMPTRQFIADRFAFVEKADRIIPLLAA
jgi:hypothetical protein